MLSNYILKITFNSLCKISVHTSYSVCDHKLLFNDLLNGKLLADYLMYHALHYDWYTDDIIMNASHSVQQYIFLMYHLIW